MHIANRQMTGHSSHSDIEFKPLLLDPDRFIKSGFLFNDVLESRLSRMCDYGLFEFDLYD
ncbi:hypothetical protein hrd7_10200 [Leptolinea sp. HRD-7]|nr:hypothetical protein hrd7_10200 [Leptolinea sp. HRD-7]